jgi:hypothetical protein
MDDLRRIVWKAAATASCNHCPFCVRGVWPPQAGKRARKHARETGHTTVVRYEHSTEYRPRGAS